MMRPAWKHLAAPLLILVACAMGCAPDEEVLGPARPGKTASTAPDPTPSPTPSTMATVTPTPTPEPTASATPYIAPSVAVNPSPPPDYVPEDPPATDSIPN